MQPAPPPPPPPPSNQVGLGLPLLIGTLCLVLVVGAVAGAMLISSMVESDPDPAPVAAESPSPSSSPSPSPSPDASPSASVDPLHDPCVVGAWTETSTQSTAEINGVSVLLTGPSAIQRFRADGTLLINYGKGTAKIGREAGHTYSVTSTGSLQYDWQTQDGQIIYSNLRGSGETVWRIDGRIIDRQPIGGSIEPERYTCSGDSLHQSGPTWTIELTRIE